MALPPAYYDFVRRLQPFVADLDYQKVGTSVRSIVTQMERLKAVRARDQNGISSSMY